MTEKERSSGVQELIDELRGKGVEEGAAEAEQIVADARRRAAEMIEGARSQSDALLEQTRREMENLKASGEDALRLARRDAVLALKEELSDYFSGEVRRLVAHSLRDEDFLRKLITEITGRAMPNGTERQIEVLVPQTMLSCDEVSKEVSEDKPGTCGYFVRGLTSDMLREGVSFAADPDGTPGLSVKVVGEDVEIDLHEDAITGFLLRHLLPRFRTLMEGSSK
jgi:V/A-type H+/Na+-transporting ATPase subunit E